MKMIVEWIGKFFGQIEVSDSEALAIKGLQVLLVLLLAYILSERAKRFIERRLAHDDNRDDVAIGLYKNIARTIIWGLAILVAIHLMGIDLKPLFSAGGMLALASAFAFKNVAENLISGIMIRLERVIKPGDILETEGVMVRIKKIGMRNTIARTKDEKDLLIPNSQLVQKSVVNYTYRDSVSRVKTAIGVSYDADLSRVREALEAVCEKMEGRSGHHPPVVSLSEFGDSQVTYKVCVWIDDPWLINSFKAKLHEAIWLGLKEADIKMAYPQIDVHFDKGFQLK